MRNNTERTSRVTLRREKGEPLLNNEIDDGIEGLNDDKYERNDDATFYNIEALGKVITSLTEINASATDDSETVLEAPYNIITRGTYVYLPILNNKGSGYEAAPTVTITNADGDTEGSGATAKAVVENQRVTHINVTNAGSGYTSAPTVTITNTTGDTTGSGATAIAKIADEKVERIEIVEEGYFISVLNKSTENVIVQPIIEITNSGSDYTENESITLSGGNGSGATATATISDGKITGIAMTNRGTGYDAGDVLVITGDTSNANNARIRISASINNEAQTLLKPNKSAIFIASSPTEWELYDNLSDDIIATDLILQKSGSNKITTSDAAIDLNNYNLVLDETSNLTVNGRTNLSVTNATSLNTNTINVNGDTATIDENGLTKVEELHLGKFVFAVKGTGSNTELSISVNNNEIFSLKENGNLFIEGNITGFEPDDTE